MDKFLKLFFLIVTVAILSFLFYANGVKKERIKLPVREEFNFVNASLVSVDSDLYRVDNYESDQFREGDKFKANKKLNIAIEEYLKVRTYFKQHNNKVGEATALLKISDIYKIEWQFKDAIPYLDSALQIPLEEDNLSLSIKSRLLYNIGECYSYLDNAEEALKYHSQALEIKQKIYPEKHFEIATSLLAIGNAHRWIRYDYYNATKYFYLSAEILESHGKKVDNTILFRCYYSLAVTFRLKSDYEQALIYGKKAAKICCLFPRTDMEYFMERAYNVIANAYYNQNTPDSAIFYYNQAIQLNKKNQPKANSSLARYYHNLGELHRNADNYKLAEKYVSLAMNFYYSNNDSLEYAQLLSKKGLLEFKRGRTKVGLAHIKQSPYFIPNNKKQTNEASIVHFNSSLFYYFVDDLDKSLNEIQESLIASSESFSDKDYTANPLLSQLHLNKLLVERIIQKAKVLLKLYDNTNQKQYLYSALNTIQLADSSVTYLNKEKIYENSVLNNSDADQVALIGTKILSKLSVDELNEHQDQLVAFFDKNKHFLLQPTSGNELFSDSLLDQQQAIKYELNYQNNRLQKEKQKELPDSDLVSLLDEKIFELEKQKRTIEIQLNNREEAIDKGISTASMKALQNFCTDNNLQILEYLWSEDTLYTLSVSKDNFKLNKVELTEYLLKNLSIYKKIIKNPSPESQSKEALTLYENSAYEIFTQLVNPFLFEGNKVLVIPDGSLSSIPFESLVGKKVNKGPDDYKSLHYLINGYNINYAFSATWLLNQQLDQDISTPAALAFGYSDNEEIKNIQNGNLSRFRNAELSNLPGTVEEIKSIAQITQGKYYMGKSATEQKFKEEAGLFDIIHLGLHGISDENNKLNTYIVFRQSDVDASNETVFDASYDTNFKNSNTRSAKNRNSQDTSLSNNETEDGYLYPWELYRLKLKNRLTVLSACETGLGKMYSGDGIYSMGRGFAIAGSESIILSLWKVNDYTGSQIISSFYNYLGEGNDIDFSLRKAKLQYLSKADEISAHPAYWATYVSIGNTQPLFKKKFSTLNTVLIFVFFVGLIILVTKYFKVIKKAQHPA
ncbi:CHAT domain-containing protein [Chondrinema litorale]|uniref:CHAT domain-containing protein n=1 Tax=Chondrinema litorale TaxID=2994555 RepID=UPI002542AD79|nr:CHAT domain-containing tetratricopeptide repeat protein [Chondrinema litorale]UZR93990.1 CHAT domain-containing protein [Chondrinema litorale]